MIKRTFTSLILLLATLPMLAQVQGWPANYGGVMLQAFYWDSFDDTAWAELENQADELSKYFPLVWIPQSGRCNGGTQMGYSDLYWFPGEDRYTSSFGTETQLRSMINTFKAKGIGTIADVVINHRANTSGWFGFPSETYKGITYTMTAADVCKNDDGGKAKTQADKEKVTLGAYDTGEDWDGMRDLDHTSTNVQTCVKAYLHALLEDLGYTGFRYDMVKGFDGSYVGTYNNDAKPAFSVGECWDSSETIKNWIEKTGKTSAAFDFQFKYVVRNAVDAANWAKLGQDNGQNNYPLVSYNYNNGAYRQWAVTFVENHDTQKRKDGTSNGPLVKDTLAANAFMMAMPGTPCVFLPHWKSYKQEIKAMIDARRLAGITNTSNYTQKFTNKNYYVVETTGTNSTLICSVGSKATQFNGTSAGYTKILSGYHYVYWAPNSLETPWVDKADGKYETDKENIDVTLTAVSANANAQLVYTTNGSDPTASSTKVASGTIIKISKGTTTLKVGLLNNGSVTKVITRTYEVTEPSEFKIPDFCKVNPGEICAFFEAPMAWSNTIKCWAWDSENYTGGAWPGVACTELGTAGSGLKVWKWTFKESDYTGAAGTATAPTQIIFNNDQSPQTDDFPFVNGGYYDRTGKLGVVTTGIQNVQSSKLKVQSKFYTLDGRLAGTDYSTLPRGIYVTNGVKVVK